MKNICKAVQKLNYLRELRSNWMERMRELTILIVIATNVRTAAGFTAPSSKFDRYSTLSAAISLIVVLKLSVNAPSCG